MIYQIHQQDAELRGIAIGEERGEKRGIAIGEERGEKRNMVKTAMGMLRGQCSKFSVNARSGARKGFPEPEVSGCEHAPTQPPRQRLGLGRLPGKC